MANLEPLVIEIRAEADNKEAFDSTERLLKKQKKAVSDTLKRMEDYKNTIGMTADELQIYKLRQSGATEAQIKQAQHLQNLTNLEKKKIKSSKGLNGSLRLVRGGFGQLGHQVQDVAVQLQGGTDAMIVFGQQGGQIASLMGPGGAMVGAFLAVGAAVFTAFKNVEQAESKFSELQTTLEGLIPTTEEAGSAINIALEGLKQAQIKAAQIELDKLTKSMNEQVTAAETSGQASEDLANAQSTNIQQQVAMARGSQVAKKAREEETLAAQANLAAMVDLISTIETLGGTVDKSLLSPDLLNRLEELQNAIRPDDAGGPILFEPESVTEAKEGIAEIARDLMSKREQIQKDYDDLRTQLVANFTAIGEMGSSRFLEMYRQINQAQTDAIAEIDAKEEEQAQREKDRNAARIEREEKAAQAKVDASIRAQNQLQALAANDVTDIDKVNKRYDAQIRAAHKAYQTDTTLFKQYQDALIAIAANRAAAIDAINDKSFADHKQKIIDLRDTALAGFRTETENYIHNLMMRQMALDEALANKAISEAEHAQNSMRLEEMKAEHMLDQQLKLIGGFQNVENAITNASHAFITGAANGTEAMRMLGRAIMDELIKSIIQMGIQKAKQAIIAKNIEAGSLAASVAANATAMTAIASASAPAAALVSLATMGGNSIPAQAGITSTVGVAKASALASFEGGGFTGSGARSGGMDGKGGFLAMLHPNETVIDHTKGQGQDITIINNIQASGDGDVDQRIAIAVSEASKETVSQVHNMIRRGRM
jgi:hypothetical protein